MHITRIILMAWRLAMAFVRGVVFVIEFRKKHQCSHG